MCKLETMESKQNNIVMTMKLSLSSSDEDCTISDLTQLDSKVENQMLEYFSESLKVMIMRDIIFDREEKDIDEELDIKITPQGAKVRDETSITVSLKFEAQMEPEEIKDLITYILETYVNPMSISNWHFDFGKIQYIVVNGFGVPNRRVDGTFHRTDVITFESVEVEDD
jgi:hypothetical protein